MGCAGLRWFVCYLVTRKRAILLHEAVDINEDAELCETRESREAMEIMTTSHLLRSTVRLAITTGCPFFTLRKFITGVRDYCQRRHQQAAHNCHYVAAEAIHHHRGCLLTTTTTNSYVVVKMDFDSWPRRDCFQVVTRDWNSQNSRHSRSKKIVGAFRTLLLVVPSWGPQLWWKWAQIRAKTTNIDQKSAYSKPVLVVGTPTRPLFRYTYTKNTLHSNEPHKHKSIKPMPNAQCKMQNAIQLFVWTDKEWGQFQQQ